MVARGAAFGAQAEDERQELGDGLVEVGGDDLAESCGKDPVPLWQWSLVSGFGT